MGKYEVIARRVKVGLMDEVEYRLHQVYQVVAAMQEGGGRKK